MKKLLTRGWMVYESLGFIRDALSFVGVALISLLSSGWAYLQNVGVIGITLFGFVVFTCLSVFLLVAFGNYGDVKPMPGPSWVERHKPWGIVWNFEGFLGANWKQGQNVYVTRFQASGKNNYKKSIKLLEASIESNKTGQSIPVKIKTDQGYREPSQTNPIPSKAKFRMQASFDNQKKSGKLAREGLPEDEFIKDFGEFTLKINHDKGSFIKTFNSLYIIAEINRVKPSGDSPPRVTAKD